jgi:transcriptional antiterminator RfaH
MNTASWYLVHTKVRSETIAELNLQRQGYTVYLPRHYSYTRRKGERVRNITAMFSRYLFIYLNTATDDWGPIRSTRGVMNVVRFGGKAALVPNVIVNQIKEVEQNIFQQDQLQPELLKGDTVEVVSGAFAGYQAMFIEQSSSKRARILIDFLGNPTAVSIASKFISKSDA